MEINRYLDHAILNPEMTTEEVKASIEEAIRYETKTVCVRGCDIKMAVEMCRGTNTEAVSYTHLDVYKRQKRRYTN